MCRAGEERPVICGSINMTCAEVGLTVDLSGVELSVHPQGRVDRLANGMALILDGATVGGSVFIRATEYWPPKVTGKLTCVAKRLDRALI